MNLFQFRPLSEYAGGEVEGAQGARRVTAAARQSAVNLATPAGRTAFARALTRGARARRTARRAR